MQITTQSTAYYQQPSQLPSKPAENTQKPQELSPEEQRAQTVQREDKLQSVQDTRQSNQDQVRSATVALVANDQKQQNIDLYIAASTGEDVESTGPSLSTQIDTLQNIARSAQVNQLATAAGQNPDAVEAIRNRPSPYDQVTPPNNLPSINEFV